MRESAHQPYFHGMALPDLYGRVNGGNELYDVKQKDGRDVREIPIGRLLGTEDDVYCPPKSDAIHTKQQQLRQQGLGTMPSYEVGAFPVSEEEDRGRKEVDDRKRQAHDNRDKRH